MDRQYYFLLMYIVAFLLILASSELIYKWIKISSEYTRKLSHVTASLTSLTFVYAFQSHFFVLGIAIFSFLLFFVGKRKNAFKSIENVSRVTLGTYLLPVGIYLSFAFYDFFDNKLLFILPVLILAISDTSAGFIGIRYRAKTSCISIMGITLDKTFAGSFTFLFSSLIISFITLIVFGYDYPQIIFLTIIISFFTTLTELISPYGSDNLTIPVVTCLILIYF